MRNLLQKIILLLILSNSFYYMAIAETSKKDSCNSNEIYNTLIIPLSLISTGLIVNKSTFEKSLDRDIIDYVGPNYYFGIDDYTQHIPFIEMYIADLAGVEARNHWFDQTKYLLLSNLISSSTTHLLKDWTKKKRPAGADDSFPSGHTTAAFTNATVLYNEFSQTSDILAYSGYAFAVTTGTFRMINNKHWLSDVLVGAGIGMLATQLVYYIEPLKDFNPFIDTENITLIPSYNDSEFALYFSYKF
jgi:membrane-associated phospholipid phosphatase